MKNLYLKNTWITTTLLVSLLLFMNLNGFSQLSITSSGTNYTIDFDNTVAGVNNGQFLGTGFEPAPVAGRLDSDAWASSGMSDGIMTYGDTKTTGDYARGQSNGNVTGGTGGFYSFQVVTGNRTLGFQPSSADFTPGSLTFRMKNNTGSELQSIDLSYNIWVNNDQGYATYLNFSYSTDSVNYIPIADLNYTSPQTANTGVIWNSVARAKTINGLNIASGASFFFRWNSDDAGGSGSRDEIALDDIVINVLAVSDVANPSSFDASPFSSSQINLGWALNASSDSVVIAYNTINTFGVPTGVYNAGDPVTGGGTILYKGTGTSTSHTGLPNNTEYYYTAWSFTSIHEYSTGVSDSATTLKPEPSSSPAGFDITATGITITCDWTDATGEQLPDAYLILLSEQNNIAVPNDGIPVADDRDVTDGTGAMNVAFGQETFTFFRLQETTNYYLKIFPYTNSGAFIDYLTVGIPSAINDTTQSIIVTKDFEDNLWPGWTLYNVASDKGWQNLSGVGAYGTSRFASMSGLNGDVLSNDWLISPALNLDLFTDDKLVFFNSWNSGTNTNELTVKYSTNYIGGDPTGATWTELTYTKATTSLTWVPSGFIDLSAISGSAVYIAFHYLSESIDVAARNWRVDEVEITGSSVANPSDFVATPVSDIQIDLAWNLNLASDSVLIAVNSSNTFGTPAGIYSLNDLITGGGTVIYKGIGTSFNHTGLTAFTNYYYRAWSMSDDHSYSAGVADDAMTYKSEPSQYPADFASAAANITITATWTASAGDQLPDAYLLLISNQDNIAAPVDGVPAVNDLDLSDGAGAINLNYGLVTYTFYHLSGGTEYFLKIYPYTNSGPGIDYKTDDPAPSASATTAPVINQLGFDDITFGAWATYSVASNKNWIVSNLSGGALNTAYYAEMNGFQQDVPSNDWLISPSFDLDMYDDENMIFYTIWKYGSVDTEIKLLYSTNYTSGDPTMATWTELAFTKSAVQDIWTFSGNVDLSAITGSNIHIAFHYLSTADPRRWRVDEIVITGTELEVINNPTNFSAVAISENEISLSWNKNLNSDDVMLAWNSVNVFGKPEGPLYEGSEIPGGGFVIYKGAEELFLHGGLNPETAYYYKAWSVDPSDIYSSGATAEATTFFGEPASHPTEFQAVANGFSQITISWTDSDADHYLVKGSSISYANIIAPVDFVQQNDSALVKNIDAITQTAVFTGLMPSTTYYFKIFPYNGTGVVTNYKIDGIVPETSAATGPLEIDIYISEIAESADNFNIRFVELYNAGAEEIDFSAIPVYLCKQANAEAWNPIQLTGTIAPGGYHIVANSASYHDTAYNTSANQYSSSVCNFNGDDGIFLYYGGNQSTGILFDAFGQVNVLGIISTGWNYTDAHVVRKRNVISSNPVWTPDEWVIVKTANYDQMTPNLHKTDITWQGAVSTNWNARGSNWSGTKGWVPDASCNVIIPFNGITNFPIITEPSACNGVEITTGATMSIQSTGTLRIVGQ